MDLYQQGRQNKIEQGRQPKHGGRGGDKGGSLAGKEITLQINNLEIQTVTLEITRNTPDGLVKTSLLTL